MICHCGASCKTSDSAAGTVYLCPACGRREVIDFSARQESPPQASEPFALSMDPVEAPKRRGRR